MDMMDIASFGHPCHGETVSGDIAIAEEYPDHYFVGIVDVLGHGRKANELAFEINSFLREHWAGETVAAMQKLHKHLKGSLGAAVGLCRVDKSGGSLRYSAIGNVVLRKFGAQSIRLVSQDGILGFEIRQPREQIIKVEKKDVVILYTDGIRDHFEAEEYRQLYYESASTIAKNIVKRFGKDHDDSTTVVVRHSR
jgi:negative regulator of sigma-B (phosphoserine phosphatase)